MKRMTFLEVVLAVYDERQRQIEKWGASRNLAPETWLRNLTEEVGEVAREIHDDRLSDHGGTELVQVAALCFAWLTDDEPPLHEELPQPLWSKCNCSECDCSGTVHRSLGLSDGRCFGCMRGLHTKEAE